MLLREGSSAPSPALTGEYSAGVSPCVQTAKDLQGDTCSTGLSAALEHLPFAALHRHQRSWNHFRLPSVPAGKTLSLLDACSSVVFNGRTDFHDQSWKRAGSVNGRDGAFSAGCCERHKFQ